MGFRAEAIVIHIMEGTLGTDGWFGSTIVNVSAHCGLSKTEAYTNGNEQDTAWHAGELIIPVEFNKERD
jgi:N-acetyl-anhydromuramyl-L-alanine amidase AmpD